MLNTRLLYFKLNMAFPWLRSITFTWNMFLICLSKLWSEWLSAHTDITDQSFHTWTSELCFSQTQTHARIPDSRSHSDTDRGSVPELEDALHGVDGDDHGLRAQFGPGHVDAQLVDVAAQEGEGQLELLQTHTQPISRTRVQQFNTHNQTQPIQNGFKRFPRRPDRIPEWL